MGHVGFGNVNLPLESAVPGTIVKSEHVLVSALPGYKAPRTVQKLTALNLWACKCTKEIPHSCLITGIRIHIFTEAQK